MPLVLPSHEPLILPSGMGFRQLGAAELRERESLFDLLQIWEPPRKRGPRKYIIGADVSDGLGRDRAVAHVLRMGTIEEPAEQVAEWVSDTVSAVAFAFVLQAIGDYYRDEDGVEAHMVVECNNSGISTQDTLQLHLGYSNLYRWEYLDAYSPEQRFSTKAGWWTTPRTRPLLLEKFRSAVLTLDPLTNQPDFVTHSPILHDEMKDFQTDGALWEAEAAKGAHDDCIMAAAIAYYIGWRLQGGETQPLEERRRLRHEQRAQLTKAADQARTGVPDFRNTPATASQAKSLAGLRPEEQDAEESLDEQLYDPRASEGDGDDALGGYWGY